MSIIKRATGIILLLMILFTGFSQERIRKEVRVVQPYDPKLSDAFKINLLPSIEDTVQLSPDFVYETAPRPYSSEYSVKPIKAARLLADPLTRLYGSYLKLGIGNYLTPLAELSINKKRSKDYSLGVYARHISSNGKVKLKNDEKVFAGYGNNELDLYGKRIYDNSVFSISTGINDQSIYYYGYDPAIGDTILEKENIKQNFLNLNVQLGYHSSYVDSGHLNYNIQVKYNYFADKFSYTENNVLAYGEFSVFRENTLLGIDLSYNYIDETGIVAARKNDIIQVSPWFKKKTGEWDLKGGLDILFDVVNDEISTHFYPHARLQFNVAEHIFNAYFSISGKLEVNNFQKIAWENPYIKSGLQVKNSNHKLNIYGGFIGNISTSLSYGLRVTYKLVDDMYFFMNDTSDNLGNQFYTEYDDVQLTTVYGEIMTRPIDQLSLTISGSYYKYTMASQERPWHKPAWDLTVSARYNLRDKILVNADIIGSGKRYVKSYDLFGANESSLNGIIDINFGMEYRYTKNLSAFLRFYNLTSSRYQKWNQYPGHGFTIMGGITYSL